MKTQIYSAPAIKGLNEWEIDANSSAVPFEGYNGGL